MVDDGNRQLGDYRILEPIRAGGMGQVYLAEHMLLGKRYAVKVLPTELARDPQFVARFHDEARVMAELRHPHIVQVHTMGQADGVYFLAMDYVTGPEGKPLSLHEHLKAQPEGRLPEGQVRKWAIQIAEALAYAHERGVVHRDLKPANILIDGNGDVKLTDFGLAKAIGSEFILSQIHETMRSLGSRPTLRGGGQVTDTLDAAATRSPADSHRTSSASSILGTYDYMAPEQRGEYGGKIDQRTDIYAFGIVLYRLLTGRRPSGMAKPPSHVVSGIPKTWDVLVARCTADDPAERYPSAAVLAVQLRQTGRAVRRRAVGSAAVVLLAVAAIVGYRWVGGAFSSSGPAPSDVRNPSATAQPATSTGATVRTEGQVHLHEAGEVLPPAVMATPGPSQVEVSQAKSTAALGRGEIGHLDDGQGFAERKRQIEADWLTAEDLYQKGALADALAHYQNVGAACEVLKKTDRQRQDALRSRNAWNDASARIPATFFDQVAPAIAQLKAAAGEVDAAFEAGDFVAASSQWREHTAQLDQLLSQHASAKAGAESARAEWQAAEQGKPAKFHAAQDVQRSVQEATRSTTTATQDYEAGRYVGAQSAWAAATSSLRKAIDAHDQTLSNIAERTTTKQQAGQYADAEKLLDDLSVYQDVRTKRIALYLAWARTKAAKETRDEARQVIERLLAQDPRNASGLDLKRQIDALFVPVYTAWPFNAAEAQRRQRETTQALGIPVTKTLNLDGGVTLELVLIPAGDFMVGSPPGEVDRDDGETQHQVTISRPHYIGITEVTQAQWQAVIGNNPSSYKGNARRPVEQVSWDDCQQFCQKLSTKISKTVRLPTEAEWEYACRAGTTTCFCFGDDVGQLGQYAWFTQNWFTGGPNQQEGANHPVAEKQPNAWGLYDMHGNVGEWCADWYGPWDGTAVVDPAGPADGDQRVLRGMSLFLNGRPRLPRSAFRLAGSPDTRFSGFGFRVVVVVSATGTP